MDYDEMLERGIEETPDTEGSGDRFEVPDPELRQEGNATVFENFRAVCQDYAREPEHVFRFLQNDLGTSGHIDESERARLTGEFGQRRVRAAIESYAEEYVRCPECGLPDTRLDRGQGTVVLRCEACGARSPAGD